MASKRSLILLVCTKTLWADVVRGQEVGARIPFSFGTRPLGMKNKRATKKFAASGKLKQTIQARHKQQRLKKQIDGRWQRNAAKQGNGKEGMKRIVAEDVNMDGDDNDRKPSKPPKVSSKGKSKVKEVDIKKTFLDGEDGEVRRELTHRVLVSTSSREMPKEIPRARMRTMQRLCFDRRPRSWDS